MDKLISVPVKVGLPTEQEKDGLIKRLLLENSRLRAALEAFTEPPPLIAEALTEDGSCIMCGFSHKNASDFAKAALHG